MPDGNNGYHFRKREMTLASLLPAECPPPFFFQTEIVEFVIWLLFSREKLGSWPKHMLCDGFRRDARENHDGRCSIPGLFIIYPNYNVEALKEAPWPQLLDLLGISGERIMIDLLVDCAIFVKVKAGAGNYYQISGMPLSEKEVSNGSMKLSLPSSSTWRTPGAITLVRSRIFYGRPSLTSRGRVQAGYRNIHILNRYSYKQCSAPNDTTVSVCPPAANETRNHESTRKIMMYMFPLQFGMHNVFTSNVDFQTTSQAFQDYTSRENEIAAMMRGNKPVAERCFPAVPKRLRGVTLHLVQRLQKLHNRCSYFELLQYYCPSDIGQSQDPAELPSAGLAPSKAESQNVRRNTLKACQAGRQPPQDHDRESKLHTENTSLANGKSYVELASPPSQVSAFCQAVLRKIIPRSFWGEGQTRDSNLALFLRKVDHFIKLRRFETMSLHEIIQGFEIAQLAWLQPPGLDGQKTSQTDMKKRLQIFSEFLYFVFDTLLIPLIASNFFVTESNLHRYQVFYFRHDTWKIISEPALAAMKEDMLEDVKGNEARQVLDSRSLGFSHMRLLPKGTKLRPIMNLRRRQMGCGPSKILGPSINSVLGPIHSVLKLEKSINASRLGSALFSVSDMYNRLKDFKRAIGGTEGPFFFAKLDVQAAFDTIPQAAVLKLMSSVPSQKQYNLRKHAEVRPGERTVTNSGPKATKPLKRWHTTALKEGESENLPERIQAHLGKRKRDVVFVESVVQKCHKVTALMDLLGQHVGQNLIKIGKKYFRQKKGIPQGSVLSSYLCNYFYGDLEAKHLRFLSEPRCLLLRLVDDFLLITLDKSKAVRFVQAMYAGFPEYGVKVSHAKTLVNFDLELDNGPVSRTPEGAGFPYCGTMIDCKTLDISRDRDRSQCGDIRNSLTVEFGRSPGQNFQRKVINSFKIQSHLMFFDTGHNSIRSVQDSLRSAFQETAKKMWAYTRCLPHQKRPIPDLVIRTIIKLTEVAFLILTSKSRQMRYDSYSCDIRRSQVLSIAYRAILEVLSRKQAAYANVISWLRKEISRLGPLRP